MTVFLEHDGRVLLVRRSTRVGSYRGRWSGVSGYLEDEPLRQAMTEIREETGLDESDVVLIRQAEPLEVFDAEHEVYWRVHPFLFHVGCPEKVRLDWENVSLQWIAPEEIDEYHTVPGLKATLEGVLGRKL